MIILAGACSVSGDAEELFRNGHYKSALKSFNQRAAEGDPNAINFVGIHYYLGAGVERDFGEAARWFERAALKRHADAQRNLGIMYMRGLGVAQDNHRAYGWMFHANAGGNQSARRYMKQMSDNVTPNATMQARDKVEELIQTAAVQ